MSSKYFLFFVAFLCFSKISSQSFDKDLALRFFEAKKYDKFLSELKLLPKIEKNPYWLVKRGIAHYHIQNVDASKADLSASLDLWQPDPILYKYLGLIAMDKKEYLIASRYFKNHLINATLSKIEENETLSLIKKCGYAISMLYDPSLGYVQSLGQSINSPNDEIKPTHHPLDNQKILFSSNRVGSTGGMRDNQNLTDAIWGTYKHDIYNARSSNGSWSDPIKYNSLTNSPYADILQGFSPNSDKIVFSKNNAFYEETVDSVKNALFLPQLISLPYEKGIINDVFFFNDSILLISADFDGGYGGLDLYYLKKDSFQWLPPINLGPHINTPYDEISPYLLKSGKDLYFSSNRLEGFGGQDIYVSRYTVGAGWGIPQNLGSSVNSSREDIDIHISLDGSTGLFTSDRPGGRGGFDIYVVYWKDQILQQLTFTDIPDFVIDTLVPQSINTDIPIDLVDLKKDHILKSFYYSDQENFLDFESQKTLNDLTDFLNTYPKMYLNLMANGIREGYNDINLFFNLKRAQTISKKLVKNGINPDRIRLISFGIGIPYASFEANGEPSSLSIRYNRRIDTHVYGEDSAFVHIRYEYPVINSDFKNKDWNEYHSLIEKCHLRYKIASSAQMMSTVEIKSCPKCIIIQEANKETFDYYSPPFLSKNDAQMWYKNTFNNADMEGIMPVFFNKNYLPISDYTSALEICPHLYE